MEWTETCDKESNSAEAVISKTFVFSKPSVLPSSPKALNPEKIEESSADSFIDKRNVFTFATPMPVPTPNVQQGFIFQSPNSEKQSKRKIARNAYEASANVFAQALKDTAAYKQLKKNFRSQIAINTEHSITCSNVQKELFATRREAKKYFSTFGTVSKIVMYRKKQMIVVVYASKEDAANAYSKCKEYMGDKFNVDWTKFSTSPKSVTKEKNIQKNIVSNLLKAPKIDEEVKSEIYALAELGYNLYNKTKDSHEVGALKRNEVPHLKSVAKSTARSEKPAAKTEKHKPDSQISDILPNASVEELKNIIRQAALSSEDKYKVLEARDRLMRLKQVKHHTLATAKVTSGTCPDMCPEKERLMREAKRQVALYELLEGEYGINHSIAIKQYSRSSADQEEPMAHELRPVTSLKMTMSYLLHEIADLCDQPGTNLGEWYHFLWDRTRGIRKDITQQELCCVDSVELVEQCARFHIVCSERLCAEESSVFDKKINSDNLTKCLQSLKYMYHDLRVKGISCKNESEFRTYIILLNLNNGNFMWDLQRLPKSIQESSEVQFALDIYSALESNNYYKFFRLVRKTTYLNACILLRYFNQVRIKALSVMVKAYCRTTSTAYPLYELIDILGFEDENEAIYFCEQIGLNVSQDELYVFLNRQNFSIPVLNVKQNRACNLIESKRRVDRKSVGQCIAGGDLPEKMYEHHIPHNSFDAKGYLTPQSINAEDQSGTINTTVDPYEFIDEDSRESEESAHVLESRPAKTETPDTASQKNVFKTIPVSEFAGNIFATPKVENTLLFVSKPSAESKNERTNGTSVCFTANTKTSSHIKSSPTGTNTKDSSASTAAVMNFGNTVFSMPPVIFTPSPLLATSSANMNCDNNSPFAMAANKKIFSGCIQGNLFAKSTASSNIFGNTGISAESTVKPLVTSSLSATHSTAKNVVAPTKKEVPSKSMVKELETEKMKFQELERVKQTQKMNENAEQILCELQKEVVQTSCSSIVREELEAIRKCDDLCEEIANKTLNELTFDMCNSILIKEMADKQRLNEISKKMKNRVVIKYFNIWKQNTYRRRRQREALDDTPVWLQRNTVDQCARSFYSKQQNFVIQNMCKRQEEPTITSSYVNSLAPIEMIIYAGIKENLKSLDLENPINFYWKLVIAWPDLENKALLWYHKKIMNQYLCPNNFTVEPIVNVYRPNQFETVHICIRYFEGLISEHNLVGTDALLFIAAASEDVKTVTRRLTKTVLSRQKLMPLPLVVIILEDGNLESQNKTIISELESLLDSGYLSEYTIMSEKNLNEKSILNLTQSAILWLAINKSPPNPLEMNYLRNIYDICITEELWLHILGDASYNTKLSYALHDPNFVISLHNEAVNHLMDIMLDPESFMYTRFPPEFKKFLRREYPIPCGYEYFDNSWKAEEYNVKLETAMSSFLLPKWTYSWPVDNEEMLFQYTLYYCQAALPDVNSTTISSSIKNDLFFMSDFPPMPSFIDILLYVIKEKVRYLSHDLKVIYNRNHIKHFRTLPWWFKSNALIEFSVPGEMFSLREHVQKYDSGEPTMKRRKINLSNELNNEKNLTLFELEPLAEFCENTRSRVMEVHHTSKEIENRLQIQRRQNSLLEEKMKNALFNEPDFLNDL